MTIRSLVLVVMCASGCTAGGSNPDMGTNNPDLVGVPPGSDLTMLGNMDLTMFNNMMSVQFHLHDNSHDFTSVNCDDPRALVTTVTFTAVEEANMAKAVSSLPCPAGQNFGEGSIMITNSMGLFDVSATANGIVMSTSMTYTGLNPADTVDVDVYVLQTDM